jgi:Ser/Thr protein kinase RdoA (MazF antagonist)
MNDICSAEFGLRYATRFPFWRFQTRAEARGYARLPLSRQELSALAGFERNPAIHRRVSVENKPLVA